MFGLSHKIQTNLGTGTLTKPGIPKILGEFFFLNFGDESPTTKYSK